jgi:hypothetical protein
VEREDIDLAQASANAALRAPVQASDCTIWSCTVPKASDDHPDRIGIVDLGLCPRLRQGRPYCRDQLQQSMDLIGMYEQGIVVHIPSQDGRGRVGIAGDYVPNPGASGLATNLSEESIPPC